MKYARFDTESTTVNHCVVSGGEGEFHNEIHTKCVPSQVQDPEGMQFIYWSLPYQFRPKAEVTGADILSNIPRHLGPPVVPKYQLQYFPVSRMSSNLCIVAQ